MPRVCHLITRLILGGAQRLALETAHFIAKRGWEVELWTGPQTGPEGSLHEEAARRGLSVRIIPDLLREVSPVHDLRALISLRRRLATSRFDVVHTHSSKAGIIGRLAASSAGAPIRIHSVHGWPFTPATAPPVGFAYTCLERFAARHAHRMIAVSEAVRDAGLKRGIGRPEQYEVIRGGIAYASEPNPQDRDQVRAELGIPSGAVVLGTVGRLDDAKDPLGAFGALRSLLEEQPDLWVVFVGDGHLRERFEHAIGRTAFGDRIVLTGVRSDARILCSGLDVFFLSSRWEGFPLAVIEAMAAGLPVVAYDVAGVGEAVGDGITGYLVQPGDTHAWSDRLRELATSREKRKRMGDAGRRTAGLRFGLERMLQDTLRLYEQLLAQ